MATSANFGNIISMDYLTFGALLWLLHANHAKFRTAWFVESVVSAALIVLIVRNRLPFFRSGPSPGCSGQPSRWSW